MGASSVLGRGVKVLHALWPKNSKIKQKQYYNKFNKESKKFLNKTKK